MPAALQCVASLVQIWNKFDHISVGYVQKTAQKQPKIVLSAGTKTFEISKLENYKSDIYETWPRYVSPEHFQYTKTWEHEDVNQLSGEGKGRGRAQLRKRQKMPWN